MTPSDIARPTTADECVAATTNAVLACSHLTCCVVHSRPIQEPSAVLAVCVIPSVDIQRRCHSHSQPRSIDRHYPPPINSSNQRHRVRPFCAVEYTNPTITPRTPHTHSRPSHRYHRGHLHCRRPSFSSQQHRRYHWFALQTECCCTGSLSPPDISCCASPLPFASILRHAQRTL